MRRSEVGDGRVGETGESVCPFRSRTWPSLLLKQIPNQLEPTGSLVRDIVALPIPFVIRLVIRLVTGLSGRRRIRARLFPE